MKELPPQKDSLAMIDSSLFVSPTVPAIAELPRNSIKEALEEISSKEEYNHSYLSQF